ITPAGADIPADGPAVIYGCIEREVYPVRYDGAQVIQPGGVAGGGRYLCILVDVLGFAVPIAAAEHQPRQPAAFEGRDGEIRPNLQFIVLHEFQAIVGILRCQGQCYPISERRRAEGDLPVVRKGLDTRCAICCPDLPVAKPGLLCRHELGWPEVDGPAGEGGCFVSGAECAAIVGSYAAGNTEEIAPIDGLVDQEAIGNG